MLNIKSFTFNFFSENTYIVYHEAGGECVIIDAGNHGEYEDQMLFDFIARKKLKVKRLLNTHNHIDHVIGNLMCKSKYQVIPETHQEDLITWKQTVQTAPMFNVNLDEFPNPVASLKEGDEITIGDDSLSILFTPGHSRGHISFYNEKQKFLLSGDVIFLNSIGRTDLPGGNFETLLNTIQKKIYTLPPETTIYSGHGDLTSVGFEMKNNPFVKSSAG